MQEATPTRSTVRFEMATWRWSWLLLISGSGSMICAFVVNTDVARAAAEQNWTPFVLVVGLLLIGSCAQEDGVFVACGKFLAQIRGGRFGFVIGSMIIITLVTTVLNLDTSVVFLTPTLVLAARTRGESEQPVLIVAILLSNASSLFLPGSNLTNLIVLGGHGLSGGEFFLHLWRPGLAAVCVTALGIVVFVRPSQAMQSTSQEIGHRPRFGLGAVAVLGATIIVLVVTNPAIPVCIIGCGLMAYRVSRRKISVRAILSLLGLPVLIGLYSLSVSMGTIGRIWMEPHRLFTSMNPMETAFAGALAALVINNLPAASLLSAQPAAHPYALLIGLNLGPNIFVTGSLAWFLWLRAAQSTGASPSIRTTLRVGILVAPISIAIAIAVFGG